MLSSKISKQRSSHGPHFANLEQLWQSFQETFWLKVRCKFCYSPFYSLQIKIFRFLERKTTTGARKLVKTKLYHPTQHFLLFSKSPTVKEMLDELRTTYTCELVLLLDIWRSSVCFRYSSCTWRTTRCLCC